MATLRFVQRDAVTSEALTATPRLGWVFQGSNPDFLYSGTITFVTGLAVDEDGHTTSFNWVRVLSFTDPGDPFRTSEVDPGTNGLRPLQFLKGRVGVTRPTYRVVTTTSSKTMSWNNGRVTITSVSSLGSVTNFSIFGLTQEDPYDFYVETATDLDSGGVSQPYTRNYAVFTPHRSTKYLAVGAKVYSMPNTGPKGQFFKKWMVEQTEVGRSTPAAKYGLAREVIVTVKPDRLNYCPNPGFEVNASQWLIVSGGPATIARTTAVANTGTAAGQITGTGSGDAVARWGSTVTPTIPGDTWSAKFSARPDTVARRGSISLLFADSSGATVQVTPEVEFVEVLGRWVEAKVENVVAPANTAYVAVRYTIKGLVNGEVHYLDSVLLEKDDTVGPYFDGSTSADTIWETGGTVGASRSYLYKNRADRYAAIKRVLRDNVPLGVGIAEPVFGTLPVN